MSSRTTADQMADELVGASHVELAFGGGVEEVARERQRLVRHVAIRRPLPQAMHHVRQADTCRPEPLTKPRAPPTKLLKSLPAWTEF